MQPITCLLVALALVASTTGSNEDHCAHVRLGEPFNRIGIALKDVTTTYWMTKTDEKLYVPIIPQRNGTWLHAEVKACNPTGHKPFLIKTSDTTAEIHCTYRDQPRCPDHIKVEIVETYPDGPLIPWLG